MGTDASEMAGVPGKMASELRYTLIVPNYLATQCTSNVNLDILQIYETLN